MYENRVVVTMFEEALSTRTDTLVSYGSFDIAIQVLDPSGDAISSTHIGGNLWDKRTDLLLMNGAI